MKTFNKELALQIIGNACMDEEVILNDLFEIIDQLHKDYPEAVSQTIQEVMRSDYVEKLCMTDKDCYDYENCIDRCNQPESGVHPVQDHLKDLMDEERFVVIQWPESQKLVKDDYDEDMDEHPFIIDEDDITLIMSDLGISVYGNAAYEIRKGTYLELKEKGILK